MAVLLEVSTGTSRVLTYNFSFLILLRKGVLESAFLLKAQDGERSPTGRETVFENAPHLNPLPRREASFVNQPFGHG